MYEYEYYDTVPDAYTVGVVGGLLVFIGIIWIISMIIGIIMIIANWKIFSKAGKPGWAVLVPIYNLYTWFDIAYPGHGWKFLYLLIPFANIYFLCKFYLDYAKAFGQEVGFGIGLILLNPIFTCILAFGSYEYQLGYQPIPDYNYSNNQTNN